MNDTAEFSFTYATGREPQLEKLREHSNLSPNQDLTTTQQAQEIIGYAHTLFDHNGDAQPSSMDPLTIMTEAQSGKMFRCVEYSILAMSLLWACGIPARVIGLKTSDVETRNYGAGHVVIEYWDGGLSKWVAGDVQAGVLYATKDLEPVSVYDFKQAIFEEKQLGYIPVNNSKSSDNPSFSTIGSYIRWLKDYLYFIDTPEKITFEPVDLPKQKIVMLVPPGVKPPKMFQRMFEMNASYATDVQLFYQGPSITSS